MGPRALCRPVSLLACLTLAGTVLSLQWQQLQILKTQPQGQQSLLQLHRQDQRDRLRLSALQQLPDLGNPNLVADWTFLSFLQYFGDTDRRDKIGYRLSPEFFEVIVEKDPRFVTPYLFLSASTSIFAGAPERSVALMTKGSRVMTPTVPTGGYRLWRYRGLDQLLFLGDAQAARQSFQTAAAWASVSREPDAVTVAQACRQTATFLATNPASRAAQISAWVQVINLAVDPQVRKLAAGRIAALGGKILVMQPGRVTVQYRSDQ
ncbi:MAG: hypothetical protein KGQ93_08330 [Cyanobacteria bacterium REEB459]|nr:hypothetical protein [Cyanobacteria bacterium REEB459]